MNSLPNEDVAHIRASKLFDAEWYLQEYPDVKALGMDPAEHYLWLGARLGRKPSPLFDTRYYHDLNADVAESGINPLLHYVRWGEKERRVYRGRVADNREVNGKSILWVVNQHDRMTHHYRVHNLSRALEVHG